MNKFGFQKTQKQIASKRMIIISNIKRFQKCRFSI